MNEATPPQTPRLIWPGAVLASLALALVLLVAAAGSWVWQAANEQHINQLRDSRFLFSALNIKSALDAGLQLGVPVAELGNAKAQIDQGFAAQNAIVSIDVLNRDGQIVFSTDASGLGARAPAEWVQACMADPKARFSTLFAQDHWLCLPLVDGIEQVVGGVMLRYEPSAQAQAGNDSGTGWPDNTAIGLLALAVLALGAVTAAWRICAPTHAALRALLTEALPPGHGASLPAATSPLQSALAAGAALQAQLAHTEAEADRIDRLELS